MVFRCIYRLIFLFVLGQPSPAPKLPLQARGRNNPLQIFPRCPQSSTLPLIPDWGQFCVDMSQVAAAVATRPGSSADVHPARSTRPQQAAHAEAIAFPARRAFALAAREYAGPSWDLVLA